MANPKIYPSKEDAMKAASEALDFDRRLPDRPEYATLDLRSLDLTRSPEDAARLEAGLAAMNGD